MPLNDTVLVHDYLNQHGGAERVLESMVAMYPHAPVFTSIYDREIMPDEYSAWDIRTTWMNRIPYSANRHQWLLPLYPVAFNRLKLPECKLVLSSSSAFAKLARPPDNAVHICYTHAPMRFAWSFDQYCERERLPGPVEHALRPAMKVLRRIDRLTTARVDQFIANSTAVRDRIRAFWRRDAQVIFPPVEVDKFQPAPVEELGDDFLVISRLVPYKRIDIVIDAFNALGLPLTVVGDGRDRAALERKAHSNIRFLGRVSDEELRARCARCQAAVFMSEDDFGITQVEVQAAGRPVIALARAGVLDSVIPGVTGVWVADRTIDGLIDAVQQFQRLSFDREKLVDNAARFSATRFKRELFDVIESNLSTHAEKMAGRWN